MYLYAFKINILRNTIKHFFVGREEEMMTLQSLSNSEQADLVGIIGRRRIGKTYLVKTAFKNQFSFHITGVKNTDKETMIQAFVANKLHKRRELFRTKTQTKKYLINTLVTTFGLKTNEHSTRSVDKSLTMDALFL